MRKGLGLLALLVVLCVGAIFFLIPSPIVVNSVLKLPTSQKAMQRWLTKQGTWQELFSIGQDDSTAKNTYLTKGGYLIFPDAYFSNSATIDLVQNRDTIKTNLLMLALGKDSMAFSWGYTFPANNNPINRLLLYFKAKKIKNIFDETFINIKRLATDEKNISGLTVERQIVVDTFFIAQKFKSTVYPTTAQIYQIIDNLQNYLTEQKAAETGYPMLHIRKIDSVHYEAMAALPTNKMLAGNGDIEFKRMVRGVILMAEVKGGPVNVENNFVNLKNFVADHGYTEIALPFQSLVTNRLQQADTTKWITKLYYPVY